VKWDDGGWHVCAVTSANAEKLEFNVQVLIVYFAGLSPVLLLTIAREQPRLYLLYFSDLGICLAYSLRPPRI
jgi:hypothetical protein